MLFKAHLSSEDGFLIAFGATYIPPKHTANCYSFQKKKKRCDFLLFFALFLVVMPSDLPCLS